MQHVREWRQQQVRILFGIEPDLFWSAKHYHCCHCTSPLKVRITHLSRYNTEEGKTLNEWYIR